MPPVVSHPDFEQPPTLSPIEVGTPAWEAMNADRVRLIEKKYTSGLTEDEMAMLERLQKLISESLNRAYPIPRLSVEDRDYLRHKLGLEPRTEE